MSVQWICASCRKRLCRQLTTGGIKPAPFTSLARDSAISPDELDLRRGKARRKIQHKHPPKSLPFQFDSSVEDDFVRRITAGRDGISAPYSTPYLNPLPDYPAQENERQNQDSSERDRNAILREDIPASSHAQQPHRSSQFTTTQRIHDKHRGLRRISSDALTAHSARRQYQRPLTRLDSTTVQSGVDNYRNSTAGDHSSDTQTSLQRETTETKTRGAVSESSNLRANADTPEALDESASRVDVSQDPYTPASKRIEETQPEVPHEAPKDKSPGFKLRKQNHSPLEPVGRIEKSMAEKNPVVSWLYNKRGAQPPSQVMAAADKPDHTVLLAIVTLCRHALNTIKVPLKRNRLDVAAEVLALWQLLFRRRGEYMSRDSSGILQYTQSSTTFQAYLNSEQMRLLQNEHRKSFRDQLTSFLALSRTTLSSTSFGIEAVVMVSLTALEETRMNTGNHEAQTLASEMKALEDLLRTLMQQSSTRLPQILGRVQSLKAGDFDEGAITRVANCAKSTIPPPTQSRKQPATHADLSVDREQSVALFKSRLARSVERLRLSDIDALWAEMQHTFRDSIIPHALFEPLCDAYMRLRRPQKAVQIWNAMAAQGTTPQITDWDTMLRGFGSCRDVPAIRQLWSNMLQVGIQLDERIWATRIHAYATCSCYDAAFEAFNQMADQWRNGKDKATRPGLSRRVRGQATSQQQSPSVPKPNTICLNAVIPGLVKSGRHSDLADLFATAKELQIPLDAYTFNPLFRDAYQKGDEQTASQLFARMRALGIQPDVATFTIQLQAIFYKTLREQQDSQHGDGYVVSEDEVKMLLQDRHSQTSSGTEDLAVKTLFDQMSAAGLEPAPHTYTTLIAGLLQQEKPNLRAVYSTVRHIAANDLPLSAQIYAMLTIFHFEQDPPDLMSVEALWHHAQKHRTERRRSRYPLILDTVFYDRFIEGWSKVGNTQRALQIYLISKQQDIRVGWRAMRELVARLMYEGNREAAGEIVKDASGRESGDSRQYATSFWRLCEDNGLVSRGQVAL